MVALVKIKIINLKDTENNSDLFFKDITDGVNVIIVGALDTIQNLAIIGGNCSI